MITHSCGGVVYSARRVPSVKAFVQDYFCMIVIGVLLIAVDRAAELQIPNDSAARMRMIVDAYDQHF
jgi:hypothetical protein